MRVLKGESGRVLLKLRLPKMNDGEGREVFNSLYSSLAAEYVAAAERLLLNTAGDVRFSVSYTVKEERRGYRYQKKKQKSKKCRLEAEESADPIDGCGKMLVIYRNHKLTTRDGERSFEIADVFDPTVGVFKK